MKIDEQKAWRWVVLVFKKLLMAMGMQLGSAHCWSFERYVAVNNIRLFANRAYLNCACLFAGGCCASILFSSISPIFVNNNFYANYVAGTYTYDNYAYTRWVEDSMEYTVFHDQAGFGQMQF